MSLNDSCRFCLSDVRVQGTVVHSKLIFDSKDRDNVCSQLSTLGLVIDNTSLRSCRIFRKCSAKITRLLRDTEMFQKWKNVETETCHGSFSRILLHCLPGFPLTTTETGARPRRHRSQPLPLFADWTARNLVSMERIHIKQTQT